MHVRAVRDIVKDEIDTVRDMVVVGTQYAARSNFSCSNVEDT